MSKPAKLGTLLLLAVWAACLTGLSAQGKPPASIDEALAAAKVQGRMLLVHFTSPG